MHIFILINSLGFIFRLKSLDDILVDSNTTETQKKTSDK